MRIYANRYYVMQTVPGISGFQRWNEREYRIITGLKAANNRPAIVAEWTPMEDERYNIEDGHLAEHQPIADRYAVARFLTANPFGCAFAVGKAHERLFARHGQPERKEQ